MGHHEKSPESIESQGFLGGAGRWKTMAGHQRSQQLPGHGLTEFSECKAQKSQSMMNTWANPVEKISRTMSQVGTSIRTTDWKWNHHQDQGKWATFATTKNSFSPWLNHGFLAERPRVRCNFHSLAAAAHEDEYDDDDNDQDQDDCGEYHGYDDDYDYDILF